MELILILAIALVVFGPKKLPEIGKAVGEAIRNFKKHSDKVVEELEKGTEAEAVEAKGPRVEQVARKAEPTVQDSAAKPKA
jgi:TatA/E family protein of Tat protein translocase